MKIEHVLSFTCRKKIAQKLWSILKQKEEDDEVEEAKEQDEQDYDDDEEEETQGMDITKHNWESDEQWYHVREVERP